MRLRDLLNPMPSKERAEECVTPVDAQCDAAPAEQHGRLEAPRKRPIEASAT